MMIYEHISNLSEKQSNRIKEATTKLGWDHAPLDKNKMTKQGISQSWEITKNKDDQFYDLFLDKHILVYRLHSDEDDTKYNRMMQWENEIRIRELQDEPIENILSKVDDVSLEDRDRIYLGNKLLRETETQSRRQKISSYLDNFVDST